MWSGTQIHNAICDWFTLKKGNSFDKSFGRTLKEYVNVEARYFDGYGLELGEEFIKKWVLCKKPIMVNSTAEFFLEHSNEREHTKIDTEFHDVKATLEKEFISNGITIGYADVVIDYIDKFGTKQTVLIEVKSSLKVIAMDINAVIRQIKKYRSNLKNVKKTFLAYWSHPVDYEIVTDETWADGYLDESVQRIEDLLRSEGIELIVIEEYISTSMMADENELLYAIPSLTEEERRINKQNLLEKYWYPSNRNTNNFVYQNQPPRRMTSTSGCFIATACYGKHSKEVFLFRQIRDEKLSKSELGKCFIRNYYKYSPYFANLIEQYPSIRFFVKKFVINPIYFLISKFSISIFLFIFL
jgi:hypothetical protein